MTARLPSASPSARPESDRSGERRVPGESGVWVFILGDMVVFAILFVTYLFYRARDPRLFAEAQAALDPNIGAANTVLLLLSSLFVVVAVGAVRRAEPRTARSMIIAAALCGVAFSTLKVIEYSVEIGGGNTPLTNDFFLYYFLLTGMHWFHLIVGLALLAALFVIAGKPSLSTAQTSFVEGGACYWHMVDLLWIVLFPLLYLVR